MAKSHMEMTGEDALSSLVLTGKDGEVSHKGRWIKPASNEFNPDQPRDATGKFTGGGSSGTSGKSGTTGGASSTTSDAKPLTTGEKLDKGENPDPHKTAVDKAKRAVADFKAKLDRLTDKPGLRTVKRGLAFMKGKVDQLRGALEERYGKRQALAIMASGQVLGWGAMGVGAAIGVPLVLPGSSLWGSLPAAAVAEGFLQAGNAYRRLTGNEFVCNEDGDEDGLTGDEVRRHAERLMEDLEMAWLEFCEEHGDEIKAAFKDR